MPDSLLIIGVVVVMLVGFGVAIRRFERRRRREGKWNAAGPINPTFGQPNPDLRAQGIRPPTIERE